MNTPLSPFIVLPLAAVAMLIVSAHVTVTQHSDAPASRRRIRVANGWVVLLALPLLAAGISLVRAESQPRLFTLVWIGVLLLLLLSVLLALLDAINTVRIVREERRRNLIDFAKARYAAEREDD